ncbi:MAG: threonine ammonia-lyase [Gammaproteobacteria bacterium]|nr:threonine ammonia-lyase [Gammaproteobacteria bacterium]NND36576.1 threonine ammonia-lyase [Gammaproteobacteria bacterium]
MQVVAMVTDHEITLADIRAAAAAIAGSIEHTPCRKSETLSGILGTDLYLKFENLQFTASFKERGALNKLLNLTADQQRAGVVAASAGNHALGVAYHGQRLNIPVTIVMPTNTPFVKVENTKSHGAEVILRGEALDVAVDFAQQLVKERRATFVHPFDDPLIMAGQGTIALEMLEAVPELDCLIVPVGGGGLISGIAVAAKALQPEIEIIGAEASLYPSLKSALDGRDRKCGGDTLAEGIAVTEIGRHTLPVVRQYVDEILLAEESELEHAVNLLLTIEKTLVEGAGAAGVAVIAANRDRFASRRVGTVLSGGNIDSRLLASILMRELVREGRITRLRVSMSDVPGQMARVSEIVSRLGGNFVDIQHHRIFTMLPAKDTYMDLMLETRDRLHLDAILEELRDAGYAVEALDPEAPG